MKSKTPVILLIALAGIAGAIVLRRTEWFTHQPDPGPGEQKVFPDEPEGAVKLSIRPRDGDPFTFEKSGETWRIVQPIDAEAVTYMVFDVVDLMKKLKYDSCFAPGQADAPSSDAIGLNPPQWTLELTDSRGKTYTLQVGRPAGLIREKTYVRWVGSDLVCVVGKDFAQTLSTPLPEYRDKTVLDLDRRRVVGLSVQGRPDGFVLRREDDAWRITSPAEGRADPNLVGTVLDAVTYLRAQSFVTTDPASLARYGLTEQTGALRVALTLRPPSADDANLPTRPTTQATAPAPAEPTRRVLLIGHPTRQGDSVYAKLEDSPTVFLLGADRVDELTPKLAKLRDPHVLAFEPKTVTRVEIRSGDEAFVYSRAEAGWLAVKPHAGPADANAMETFLGDLAALTVEEWSPLGGAAATQWLAEPVGTISLHLAGRQEPLKLLRGPASPTGRLTAAKPSDTPAVAQIKTDALEAAFPAPSSLWSPDLFEMPASAEVTGLIVRKPGETWRVVRDANGVWQSLQPLKVRASAESIKTLVDRLRRLEAEKVVFVGPMVPNRFRADKNMVSVVLEGDIPAESAATQPATATAPTTAPSTRPAGESFTHIFQAVRQNGRTYAWVAGPTVAVVGEFPSSLYDAFMGELRYRRLWDFDPHQVREIRMKAGPDGFHLVRRREGWGFATDAAVEVDQQKVRQYLQNVQFLRADRFYTHTREGQDDKKLGFANKMLTLELSVQGRPRPITLEVSTKGLRQLHDRFARASTVPGVFLLGAESLDKLTVKVGHFEK